jgi:hypothetical protein
MRLFVQNLNWNTLSARNKIFHNNIELIRVQLVDVRFELVSHTAKIDRTPECIEGRAEQFFIEINFTIAILRVIIGPVPDDVVGVSQLGVVSGERVDQVAAVASLEFILKVYALIGRHVSARIVALLYVSRLLLEWHDLTDCLLLHVGVTKRARREFTETRELPAGICSRDS